MSKKKEISKDNVAPRDGYDNTGTQGKDSLSDDAFTGSSKKPAEQNKQTPKAEVSKSKAVALTFELSAAPIVYAESKIDITEDVIKAYDKKYPGK